MADFQFMDKKGRVTLGGLVDLVTSFQEESATSLFKYARRAQVNSKVYIENTIANDEILVPLMQNITTLYTGLVLTALNLNQNVDGGSKVSDTMEVVATEDFSSEVQPGALSALEAIDSYFGQPRMRTNDAVQSGTDENNQRFNVKTGTGWGGNDAWKRNDKRTVEVGKSSGVIETEGKIPSLPTGRVIQCQMHTDSGAELTVNMMLQLSPTIISTETAQNFISLNFNPSWWQRFLQAQTGEISFFSDFLFGCDMRSKRRKALINDKTNALHDMLARQQNSLHDSWMKKLSIRPDKHNIANTILIFNKQSFDRACSNAGLKFSSASNRARFFDKSFAMMLCTIDPMFNEVTMYYNGIDSPSTWKYDQVKRESKKESTDIVSIMKTYAQGMAPKF